MRRFLLVVVFLGLSSAAASDEVPSTSASPLPGTEAGHLASRRDGWFAAASAVGVAASALGDRWVWRESQAAPGAEPRRLARFAQHFGDPVYVGPALLAGYAAGRLVDVPGLAAGSARVAVSALVGGVECIALKFAIGRARPVDSPGDPWDFRPFQRTDASFPSGHTTIAFATASAIDAETSAGWVPWVVYPVAATVGYARVAENRHWTSDVVAGAALGFWTGRRVDSLLKSRFPGLERATFLMRGSRRSFRLGVRTRF